LFACCAVVAPAVAFASLVVAADPLADLGVTPGRAREAVFDTIAMGSVSLIGNAGVFTRASTEVRVALVTGVAAFARAYVESQEFAARYADHREANQPDPPPPTGSADEILAGQRADWEKQVEQIRGFFPEITPEQRATLERGFEEVRERFKRMETDAYKAGLEATLAERRAEQMKAYEASREAFEKQFPRDPRTLVASRLRAFLELTRDIDYGARLVERGGTKRFADATLEARPREWKLCFRAGRAATDAARTFAEGWLRDLEARGIR
jgi:hypothetical protein